MQFLNIHTYKDEKDQSIKIRIDVVYKAQRSFYMTFNLNKVKNLQFSQDDLKIVRTICNLFKPDVLEKALLPSESSEKIFEVKVQKEHTFNLNSEDIPPSANEEFGIRFCRDKIKKYQHVSVTYTLSTNPHLAMYQIWSFVTAAIPRNRNYESTTIYFSAALFNYFHGKEQQKLIDLSGEFDSNNAVHESLATSELLQNLQQYSEVAGYKNTMEALKIITAHYLKQKPNNGRLLDCLEVDTYCMLLQKPLTELFLNQEITSIKKINALLSHARTYIAADKKEELNSQINSLHALAIKHFIAPCIGQVSHEGFTKKNQVTYNVHYTELSLLECAEFAWREDGRLSIINLQSNKGYQNNYAPGQRNHGGLLKEELLYLGHILGFEVDTDSDYDKEIIFTRECSKKLQNKGLHITLNYIKSLLHAQNQSVFFKHTFKNIPEVLYPKTVNTMMQSSEEELSAVLDEREINNLTPCH